MICLGIMEPEQLALSRAENEDILDTDRLGMSRDYHDQSERHFSAISMLLC